MSIPLVRNNTKDAINTSIIAIKKNLERINSLLGLVDNSDPDLSGLATKQELENAVTEINDTIDEVETSLQPVDTVTSGNMHSVTSNAVYDALNTISYAHITVAYHGDYMYLYKVGKVVYMSLSSDWTGLNAGYTYNLATIPEGYRPVAVLKLKETTKDCNVTLQINDNGHVFCYNYDATFTSARNGQYYGCWITEE